MSRTKSCWNVYNTGSPVWFQEWSNCHIILVLHSWVCGHLKRDDTVLICRKFSVCTKDCLWLHFAGFFTLSSVTNTRGHSAKVLKNHCSLELRCFFFSERVIDRWNSLPQHVIDSTSISVFKNGLNIMRRDSMGFFMGWLVRLALRPHMFLRILWNTCSRTW